MANDKEKKDDKVKVKEKDKKDKEEKKKEKEDKREEKDKRRKEKEERRKTKEEQKKEADEKRAEIEQQIKDGTFKPPPDPKEEAAKKKREEAMKKAEEDKAKFLEEKALAEVKKADEKKWSIEPPEKKLKSWQDDNLEVDSDEEAKAKAESKPSTLAFFQKQKNTLAFKGDKQEEDKKPAEDNADDSLDTFMTEIHKGEQERDREKATKAGKDFIETPMPQEASMGVMAAAQVKSITLEEIQALMGLKSTDAEPEASTEAASSSDAKPAVDGAATAGQSASSSSTAPAPAPSPSPKTDGDESMEEEEDEEQEENFRAAFLAEIKRRQEGGDAEPMEEKKKEEKAEPLAPGEQPEYMASSRFSSKREGYVFTTRRGKTGYYLDHGPFAIGKKRGTGKPVANVVTNADTPRIRLPQLLTTAEEGIDVLGFVPSAFSPNPVFIKSVDPGSWSEAQGIIAGDELVMVNGMDPLKITKAELLQMMRDRPVSLAFARHVQVIAPTEEEQPEPEEKKEEERMAGATSDEDDDDDESEDEEELPEKKPAAKPAEKAAEGAEAAVADSKAAASQSTPTGVSATSSSSAPRKSFDDFSAMHKKKTEGSESSTAAKVASEDPQKPLSKKDKRRLRREAKDKERGDLAKKQFDAKGGEDDREVMEADPDQSEQSSLEEDAPSYFDLVKQFTTKKNLPKVDHSKITYKPFKKNLYIQVKEITSMKEHEIDEFRRLHGDIKVRGKHCPRPIKSFLQCGLPEKIIKLMEKRDVIDPFPIQMQAIPALMTGRDLIGVAQTGSGKTLSYLLPLIRHIMDQPPIEKHSDDGPIGFIVAPTRELALQIQREADKYCKAVNLSSVCAYGGGPMGEQLSALKKGCHILVGTPGRLIDVLTISNGKITNLRRVTFMILDEADRMFDMGFEPQIGMFLQATRPDKQIALFSATLPAHVEALARTVLKKPLEIGVGERNTAATNVTQFVEVLDETQKFYRLLQLLGEWHEHGSIIIFVHHQKDVDEMFTELLKYGYPSLALHGGQDQCDRDFTLQDFKDNVANVMIATSVAARGIDVKQCILVINFKVPDHLEDYIHRIGRTGRAGKHGFAYTFIQPDEGDRAQDMLDALRQCGQEVPEKLRQLAEEHQSLVNTGQATKKRRWGGFGGKGFKYDNTEKSRQQKERKRAKDEFCIGDDFEEVDEDKEKDPWDQDQPMNEKKNEKKKEPEQQGKPSDRQATAADPLTTAEAARKVAEKMKAELSGAPGTLKGPPLMPTPKLAAVVDLAPANSATGEAAKKLKDAFKAGVVEYTRKTEEELSELAEQMAEDTLANMPEDKKAKALPALKEKLKKKLMQADEEAAARAGPDAAPPPPAAPKAEPVETPLAKAVLAVPGVLGVSSAVPKAGADGMIARSIEALNANIAAAKKAPSVAEAERQAAIMLGMTNPNVPVGHMLEEFEINDYPEVARKRVTAREPLLAIEEITGAKLWVKGQHFADARKMPEGSRKLYVEIIGPTSLSVQKALREIRNMMEALAIRTLAIPGATNQKMGQPGRYDPATGR